jgi:hypothetical protein
MAYWRSYRKFRDEANRIAEHSSSEEEDMIAGEDTNLGNVHDNCDDGIGHQEDVLDSCNDSAREYTSMSDSDCDSTENSDENDTAATCNGSAITLGKKLANWATKNNCQRGTINELLGILREEGHCLPKDSRTLLATPRVISTLEKCGGQYIYLGIEHGVREILCENPSFVENNDTVKLKVNVDGLPLFKSSSYQFWPILGCFGDFEVFIIALYYGNTKPTSVDEYLNDFLEELAKLKRDGLTHESHKLSLNIHCFLCDAPARDFLKCIIGHTGYYACERCIMKGLWNGRVVYNSNEQCILRTEENFANLMYENHQRQASPLIANGISCIHRFPLDYMHLVCLGVTKRLLHYLKSGPKECKLSSTHIAQISEKLVSLHGSMPSEFARQPRSLKELDRWKATEYRQFLLYTGPVVLRDVLPKKVYQHFLSLSLAIAIMLDTNVEKRNAYLQYARELIAHFVHGCEAIYGNTFVVYNVHSLLHLPDDVHFFQASLNEISCFPFENYMQQLKRLVRNAQNPIAQVVKRLKERDQSLQIGASSKYGYTTISSKLKDRCFLLNNSKYAFVVEKKEENIVCDVISDRHTESVFENPADSKLFDIVYVRNVQRKSKRCLVEKSQILRKAVCLPYKEGLAIFPLHHEVERR